MRYQRRRFCCAMALVVTATFPIWARAEEHLPGFADEVASLLPAVVAIQTDATTPHGSMEFVGSGFVIDPSGVIVTNRHVLGAPTRSA